MQELHSIHNGGPLTEDELAQVKAIVTRVIETLNITDPFQIWSRIPHNKGTWKLSTALSVGPGFWDAARMFTFDELYLVARSLKSAGAAAYQDALAGVHVDPYVGNGIAAMFNAGAAVLLQAVAERIRPPER